MGSQPGPNVLLVVLDSVRAANCSLYGADRETTPFLESLADRATTYTNARAPSNWSLPSHVSIFTGLETHRHRVTVHDRLRAGHDVFSTLAERGYATGLFSRNEFLTSPEWGLAAGFDTVAGVDGADPATRRGLLDPAPDGYYFVDRFLAWSRGQEPWAACINLMDAHRPFEPRTPHDRWSDGEAHRLQAELPHRWEWAFYSGDRPYRDLGRLESLYDGAIRQADDVLRHLVARLRRRGELGETLLVVCADHGDGFGEPGRLDTEPPAVSHIVPMHESLLHVPLVVRAPGQSVPRRVAAPASLTRLPEVVTGYVDGDPAGAGFATTVVRATKQPVTADLRDRFAEACKDVAPFIADSRTVYRPGPGSTVRKRYYWGEEAAELILNGCEVVGRRAIDASLVDDEFDESAADVRESLAGRDADEETCEQLAALGYY